MPRDQIEGDDGPCVILFIYAVAMMMSGALSYSARGSASADAPYAASAGLVYVANGFAALLFAAAAASRKHGRVRKGEAGFLEYMIGIHAGLVLPLLAILGCVAGVVWVWGDDEDMGLAPFLALDAVISAITFALLVQYRPKKAEIAAVQPPLPKAIDVPVGTSSKAITAKGNKPVKRRKKSKVI
jgi:cytochrome bd-type quinol oxidase subunit 2